MSRVKKAVGKAKLMGFEGEVKNMVAYAITVKGS